MATCYYEFWTIEPRTRADVYGEVGSQTYGRCVASGTISITTSAANTVVVPKNVGAAVCKLTADAGFQYAKGSSPNPAAATTTATSATSAAAYSPFGSPVELWVSPGDYVGVIALGS